MSINNVGSIHHLLDFGYAKQAYIEIFPYYTFYIYICDYTTLQQIKNIELLFGNNKNYINTNTWQYIQVNSNNFIILDDRSFKDSICNLAKDHKLFEALTILLAHVLYYFQYDITSKFKDDIKTRVFVYKNSKEATILVAGAYIRACKKLELIKNTIYEYILRKRSIIKKIQRAYRRSYYDPSFTMCKKRLLREFDELVKN